LRRGGRGGGGGGAEVLLWRIVGVFLVTLQSRILEFGLVLRSELLKSSIDLFVLVEAVEMLVVECIFCLILALLQILPVIDNLKMGRLNLFLGEVCVVGELWREGGQQASLGLLLVLILL
jgi:hypothetical protein